MTIEASPVSETTIQDASVLESCVQRKFAPAPIWTKAMLAALQTGVKGGKWHSLWPNAFFADLGLFTLSEAHHHRSLTPMLQVYAQCIA
jgi:hypothetical protein